MLIYTYTKKAKVEELQAP